MGRKNVQSQIKAGFERLPFFQKPPLLLPPIPTINPVLPAWQFLDFHDFNKTVAYNHIFFIENNFFNKFPIWFRWNRTPLKYSMYFKPNFKNEISLTISRLFNCKHLRLELKKQNFQTCYLFIYDFVKIHFYFESRAAILKFKCHPHYKRSVKV